MYSIIYIKRNNLCTICTICIECYIFYWLILLRYAIVKALKLEIRAMLISPFFERGLEILFFFVSHFIKLIKLEPKSGVDLPEAPTELRLSWKDVSHGVGRLRESLVCAPCEILVGLSPQAGILANWLQPSIKHQLCTVSTCYRFSLKSSEPIYDSEYRVVPLLSGDALLVTGV